MWDNVGLMDKKAQKKETVWNLHNSHLCKEINKSSFEKTASGISISFTREIKTGECHGRSLFLTKETQLASDTRREVARPGLN